jgi:hypothetical protein
MKKIIHILLLIILISSVGSCAGYKPILSSSNLNFKISKYKIEGNKRIGNQIYYKLNYLSKSEKNKSKNIDNYDLFINVTKKKEANVKSSTGKILYYKISLITNIFLKDFDSNKEILNENLNYSSSYKVADQYSETLKEENKIIKDLINKTTEDFITKLSSQIIK